MTDGGHEPVRDSRILVTGGLGFIGAWLAHRLRGRGNDIVLLDRGHYRGSTAEALHLADHPDISVVQGDVCASQTYEQLDGQFDYIVHAAGFLGIQRVARHPVSTLDININGTHRCLEFARTQPALKRFVVFSTSEVYGRDAIDVSEASAAVIDVDSMRWGYAASKLATEFFAQAYRAEHRVPVVIVRPFNVYGPLRRGSNAITMLVARAMRGEDLEISGDGSQSRSWCYISDFIDGLERLMVLPTGVGQIFNLGNDKSELSLRELAELIVARTGSRSVVRIMGDGTPDVRTRRPVIDKARLALAYEPRVDMVTGIDNMARAICGELVGQIVEQLRARPLRDRTGLAAEGRAVVEQVDTPLAST